MANGPTLRGVKTIDGFFGKVELRYWGSWKQQNPITDEIDLHESKITAQMTIDSVPFYGEGATVESAIKELYASYTSSKVSRDIAAAIDVEWTESE